VAQKSKEQAGGRPAEPQHEAEVQKLRREVGEMRSAIANLANANSFQSVVEQSLGEICSKLSPLRSLDDDRQPLSAAQVAALDRIQDELKRPPDPFMYLVPTPSRPVPGLPKGQQK
jgi:hypothetical protein